MTPSLLIVSEWKLDIFFYRLDEISDITDLCSDLSFHFLCRNHLHYSPSIDHRINAVKGLPLLQCDTGTCSELAHLVLSGDSNGDLHITIITESLDQCERISSHVLYNNIRPILSIDMVRISKDHIIAVVGDSAGKVTIWILPGQNFRSCLNEEESNQLFSEHFPSKPACTYIAHTMGTNSVSIIVIEDFKKDNDHATSVLICSGNCQMILCPWRKRSQLFSYFIRILDSLRPLILSPHCLYSRFAIICSLIHFAHLPYSINCFTHSNNC